MLKYKKEITTTLRKQYNTRGKDEFRCYYDNAYKLIDDFRDYKEQTVINPTITETQKIENATTVANNIKQIWMSVDPDMAIFPRNMVSNPDSIEDNFYRPHLNLLIKNLNLPKDKQSKRIQASTIKSRMCTFSVFCRFLTNRGVFINIPLNCLSRTMLKTQELNFQLK